MNLVTLELPKLIKVADYCEFNYINYFLHQFCVGIKIENICYVAPFFIGIVYKDKDKDYYRFINECKENGII